MNESKLLFARSAVLGPDHRVADSSGVEATQSGTQARRLLGMVYPRVMPVELRRCCEYEHADNRRGKSRSSLLPSSEVPASYVFSPCFLHLKLSSNRLGRCLSTGFLLLTAPTSARCSRAGSSGTGGLSNRSAKA